MAKKITEDGEVLDVVTHEIIARAPPFFKTPYNHDTDAEAAASALICKDPSKTQQQFAKDSDINVILAKFMNTGQLPLTGAPVYEEGVELDLMDRMVTSYDVEQAWNKLPKEARAILHTPEKFVQWYDKCVEEGNIQGLRDIGLIPPAEPLQETQATTKPVEGTPAPEPASKAPTEPKPTP